MMEWLVHWRSTRRLGVRTLQRGVVVMDGLVCLAPSQKVGCWNTAESGGCDRGVSMFSSQPEGFVFKPCKVGWS